MDQLLFTVVIVLVYALSGWLQKKAEARQAGAKGKKGAPISPPGSHGEPRGPAAPTEPAPPQPTAFDWQRELRRLLEGDVSEPSPSPIIKQEPPGPTAPPVIAQPKISPPPTVKVRASSEGPETSRLTEAAIAYRRAQHLHDEASMTLQQVVEQAKRRGLAHSRAIRRPVSPELASAVSLVRNPASVRQAIVASIVLGAPKGLES